MWVYIWFGFFVILLFYHIGSMKLKNDADARTCEQMYLGCANTVDQCLTKFSGDLMRKSRSSDTTSGSDTTNIDLCVGTLVTGANCNAEKPGEWTPEECSQRYLPIEDTSDILAYQCIHSGARNNCNSWNDDAGTATFCRVPPQ